jgi:HEPN domain-containing protein
MRLKRPAPGSAEDWLRHAESDLAVARLGKRDKVLLETLCFHAQQATEKSLKAVLVHKCIVFPPTHDLALIITIIQNHNFPLPKWLMETAILTDYAVGTRYPGPWDEVTEEEYLHALEIAGKTLIWAREIVSK